MVGRQEAASTSRDVTCDGDQSQEVDEGRISSVPDQKIQIPV
jgi:hypothetical protein